MMGTKWTAFALMAGLLLLAACGGSGGELPEPTSSDGDPIADSVQQTVAAIAVAQTVAALTTLQAAPTQAPVENATEPPPTPVVESSATSAAVTTAPPPTAAPPTTAPPPTATTAVAGPPRVENDAPGGSFPEDGTVSFNIIVDPTFLFRMDVRDLDVGDFEGAGIESVGFSISGDGVNYFREERNPGFCVFGGGEPHCNPWPTNEHGQYTWGEGGPIVQSGEYFVNMGVTAEEPDEEFFGNWNWNFNFRVTVP